MDNQELELKLEELYKDSYMWALRCTYGNHDEAEDLLQNVYLKILENKAVYNNEAAFKTWLFSVIRFTAVDMHRRKSSREKIKNRKINRKSDPKTLHSVPKAIDEIESKEQKKLLHQLVASLSPKQQEVVDLVFYHDLTLQDAAQVMDVTIGTARTHYARAKKLLKEAIQKYKLESDFQKY